MYIDTTLDVFPQNGTCVFTGSTSPKVNTRAHLEQQKNQFRPRHFPKLTSPPTVRGGFQFLTSGAQVRASPNLHFPPCASIGFCGGIG